jgi:hypothetical protein
MTVKVDLSHEVNNIDFGCLRAGAEDELQTERDNLIISSRKLHNEELHNPRCLPNIVSVIKSRRMR